MQAVEICLPLYSQPYRCFLTVFPSEVSPQEVYYNIRIEASSAMMALLGADETIDLLLDDRACRVTVAPLLIDDVDGKKTVAAQVMGSIFPYICRGNA